jgi:predicted Zn-dependent peptidase
MKSSDRYATRILASILGDEGGSRLFWDLIDSGRAEVATVWPQEFTDTGAWFTYLVCAPKDSQENAKSIDAILAGVATSGVEQDELDQAINKATAGCIMQSERPANRLFGLGSRWLTCGEYVSTDDTLSRLRALDVRSVSEAAAKYLVEQPKEVVAAADVVNVG